MSANSESSSDALGAMSRFFVGDPRFARPCSRRRPGLRRVTSADMVGVTMLVAGYEAAGSLNFYAFSRAAFSDEAVDIGLQFATHAAMGLANSQAYWHAHQLGDMAQAVKLRATIEQAKGIMMGAHNCSADEAFQLLLLSAQRENRELREIANDVVARTARPRGQQFEANGDSDFSTSSALTV